MKQLLLVFFTSAVPVIEQRGAIPVGILGYGMDPYVVFFVSLLGSMIPFPFIYYFMKPVFRFIKAKTPMGKWAERLEKRTLSKSGQIVKYEFWGLLLFVGVPLPGTGIWTGTMAAVLLNMKMKHAFFSILGGAIMSALLITLAVTGVINIFGI